MGSHWKLHHRPCQLGLRTSHTVNTITRRSSGGGLWSGETYALLGELTTRRRADKREGTRRSRNPKSRHSFARQIRLKESWDASQLKISRLETCSFSARSPLHPLTATISVLPATHDSYNMHRDVSRNRPLHTNERIVINTTAQKGKRTYILHYPRFGGQWRGSKVVILSRLDSKLNT